MDILQFSGDRDIGVIAPRGEPDAAGPAEARIRREARTGEAGRGRAIALRPGPAGWAVPDLRGNPDAIAAWSRLTCAGRLGLHFG